MCQATALEVHKDANFSRGVGSSATYAKIGTAAHALTILNIGAFAWTILRYVKDDSGIGVLDPEWKQAGFCVTNVDVPYWNSHDMCLYVDTVLAAIIGAVYLGLRNHNSKEANEFVFANIPGILAHGMVHGAMGKSIRDGTSNAEENGISGWEKAWNHSESMLEMAIRVMPVCIFWFLMLKVTSPHISWKNVLALTIPVAMGNLFVNEQFGFTYTQTVLFMTFAANQLARPSQEKESIAYALYPSLVGLPLSFIGWLEATQCSNLVRDTFYGHLVYDSYIPVATLVFYFVCYRQHQKSLHSMQVVSEGKKLE